MQLQILEIVLWPRGGSSPRRLAFRPGVVNVITGASRTGKSAVIPIVDYCLASGSCSIPVDIIRNACSWFGVILQSSGEQLLLARREPGAQRATDDMMMVRGASITEVPTEAFKNTTAPAVRQMLDELAGLSNLESNPDTQGSGFEGRPSFRDMAAFTFQPQNVVANPDVLFYKTSTYEHREKLRNIFPYVLGAVTAEILAKRHEVGRLRAELRRKQRELAAAQAVSARWEADVSARFSEAKELGLIAGDFSASSRRQILDTLRELTLLRSATPAVSSESINEALGELRQLDQEEGDLSSRLTQLRRRLEEMDRAQAAISAYSEARTIQRDRLEVSSWLRQHSDEDHECPVCGSQMGSAVETLEELIGAAKSLEDSEGGSDVPAAFDREFHRVRLELSRASERLLAVQVRRNALSSRSDQLQSEQYRVRAIERFLGNVENALRLHESLEADGDLVSEVAELGTRVEALDSELARANIDQRMRRALEHIDLSAGRLLPSLDAEFPNAPVHLRVDDLTVRITRQDRQDILSEIGSGSNWLSYHLATMLALHQFFLTLPNNPVPSFIVLDQPSQVYFPKRLVSRPDDPDDEKLRDEDVEAVRKAFRVLSQVVEAANGKLQVIVLDHVSENVWGNIPGVHKVAEWRDGEKLVPSEWILA